MPCYLFFYIFAFQLLDDTIFWIGNTQRGETETMENREKPAVLFDCWSTVITFEPRRKDWNTYPLWRHCVNRDHVDFEAVVRFVDDFFHQYYRSLSPYEILSTQILSLTTLLFDIRLDCPLSDCALEILDELAPQPVEGVSEFLSLLDEREIPYAILSNTVYDDEKTMRIVLDRIPGARFHFFLGSDRVGVKKPNPLFFQAGLHLLGASADQAIYIGDSFLADVKGSFQAGFRQSYWLRPKKDDVPSRVFGDEGVVYRQVSGYRELSARLKEGRLFR